MLLLPRFCSVQSYASYSTVTGSGSGTVSVGAGVQVELVSRYVPASSCPAAGSARQNTFRRLPQARELEVAPTAATGVMLTGLLVPVRYSEAAPPSPTTQTRPVGWRA